MAFNPQDRFVVMVGNTMIVTTQSGAAFGADVVGRNISAIFRLNPDLCIRLHFKVWTTPNIAIQTMLTNMQDLFGRLASVSSSPAASISPDSTSRQLSEIWMWSRIVRAGN